MKNLSDQKHTLVFLIISLFLNTLGIKSQEKIVFNGVIDWAWSPRESLSYAGNGFYWWHRPTESPGYITNYGQMPANDWTTPYDYSNGTFYFRFEVLEQPTNSPFSIQFGIWQDKSSQKEVVSTRYLLSGGPGTKIERSIGSPSTWHNVFPTDVDFTRPEDFYRMGLVLWKGSGSCIPMAQGWSNSAQCPDSETEQLNFFPMRARVTLVAVAAGRTFSGWSNYPPPQGGGTKPPIPTYSIDYANELTNKVIPSTDEYAYNASMTGAVSGNSNKLAVTPGQNVYFRTKASGENPASDIQALNVPVRPAAPVFTYDPVNQRTSSIVSSTYEFAFSPEMNSAVTGTNNYVTYPAGTTCYFRRKATSTSFSSAIQALPGTSYIPPVSCSGYTTHYWKLEENGSAYLYDYAGSLDANIIAAPIRVNGKVDYAQEFNGTAEASLPDDGSFDWNANASFTIEWWMNKSSSCATQTTAGNNVIIGRDDPNTQLHWWAGVSCADPGKINFNLIANNGSGQNLVSNRNVIDGNWHHIVVVRNGTQGTTSIYIDGARDTTVAFSYTGDFVSNVPVNIGWLNLGGRYHYQGILDELAIYDQALPAEDITAHFNSGNGQSYCFSSGGGQQTLKIMPLGNSITFDNNIGDTRPIGEKVAYRIHLYNLLNHAGYDFDFVGSEYGGYNLFSDAENAGFPGIRAYQITQLLNSGYNVKDAVQETPGPYLDHYLPDIILLHIGTNAVQESAADVEDILDEIDAYKYRTGKDTKVVMARIINRQVYNETTTLFNNNLAAMAINRNDPDIYLVDMENGSGINYALDMTDLLHPNATGYKKMAVNWFLTLSAILPPAVYKPRIEVAPETSATVHSLYTSKVFAVGSPAPTFSLLEAPSGMSINAQSGAVTWTPSAMGSYSVSVVAENSQGSDTVSYTLTVGSEIKNVGYTQVFGSSSGASNRRAQPVTMPEDGILSSITVYHNGGSGNMILAVYNTVNGYPGNRLSITEVTPVNSSAGWQTVNLTSPISVSQGQVIWLAWVFQNSVGLRYASGTPGRVQSPQTYSGGMPESFGTGTGSASIYSIYATYTTNGGSTPLPPEAPTSLSASAVSSSQINLTWTDNAANETGFEIERSASSGSGFQVIHTTLANATSYSNTGLDPEQTWYYRVRAFNDQGYSDYTAEVQATTPANGGTTTGTVGNTQVFASSSGASNRRAQPVTMPEDGILSSITVYHNGGSGNMILAMYNTVNGYPGNRMSITEITPVNSSAGWQTVNLTSPISVSQGQVIWLAWVFQNSVGLRYASGTPGRVQSPQTYSGGMPETFGTGTGSASIYSIYATYTTSGGSTPLPPEAPTSPSASAVSASQINISWTDNAANETGFKIERSASSASGFQVIHTTAANATSYSNTSLDPEQTWFYRIRAFNDQGYSDYTPEVQATTPAAGGITTGTVGNTQVFSSSSGGSNRRAQPVIMAEDGILSSITVYHNGGSGNMILAVYNTVNGYPGNRLSITEVTPVNSSAGWQTVNLTSPISVSQGQVIWLAWVFQNSVGLRYASGTPGRVQSPQTYSGGMPESFGTGTGSASIYSIYATYTTNGGSTPLPPEAPTSPSASAVSSSQINLSWTDNAANETGFEIERSASSGSGFQVIHTTAANATSYSNTALDPEQTWYYRVRAFNDQGYSDYTPEVQATTTAAGGTTTGTVGNTQVFASSSGASYRRAQPVTMPEDGTISSITVYHNGGSGNMILAVYNTVNGYPGDRLAITEVTPVNSSAGWQTVNLTSPVSVSQGQVIWLAWVFQNAVGLRYTSGTPGRVQSPQTYSGGMPESFGTGTGSASIYSIYATYESSALKSTALTGGSTSDFDKDYESVTSCQMEIFPTLITSSFTIRVNLPETREITIDIYNLQGIKIKRVINGRLDKGEYHFVVDDLAESYSAHSGVLLVRFVTKDTVINQRIMILTR